MCLMKIEAKCDKACGGVSVSHFPSSLLPHPETASTFFRRPLWCSCRPCAAYDEVGTLLRCHKVRSGRETIIVQFQASLQSSWGHLKRIGLGKGSLFDSHWATQDLCGKAEEDFLGFCMILWRIQVSPVTLGKRGVLPSYQVSQLRISLLPDSSGALFKWPEQPHLSQPKSGS